MYAIISVHDKDGVERLASAFRAIGVFVLATPGTRAYLGEHGFDCMPVSDITGFESMCAGGIKTLHPAVHKMITTGEIGYVVVDFLPPVRSFDGTLTTDIGGPALVLSGIKHYDHVCVIARAAHVDELARMAEDGDVDGGYRKRCARRAQEELIAYEQRVLALLEDDDDQRDVRAHH
ncbi:MAG TPA: hypothetical protein ENN11_01320 [Methanomicrobia archaeon]|nr:hypothetical protein [Methanomicrobia archaeon]